MRYEGAPSRAVRWTFACGACGACGHGAPHARAERFDAPFEFSLSSSEEEVSRRTWRPWRTSSCRRESGESGEWGGAGGG